MIQQCHTAQQRKTCATKKLEELWQHYPELQEDPSDSNGSQMWKQLTAIASQSSRDHKLAMRCLNSPYVDCLGKLNQESNGNKWYTSGDFQAAKKLLDDGSPWMEERVNYEAMGLNWYRGLVMPLSDYRGMDGHNDTNQLCTMSPSIPPAGHWIPAADHGIPPADHEIPIPPPSPNKSKMLPPPTPSTKGKDKDGNNIGGLLIDQAEDGSEDGTSIPTETEADMIRLVPTETDAGTIPPAPTNKEVGTTPEKPTDPPQKGTPKPNRPATPWSECSISDDDTEEEYMTCFLQWLGLDPDCKKMLDDKMIMLAHHERRMGS